MARIAPRGATRVVADELADRYVLDGGWVRVVGHEVSTPTMQQAQRRWRRYAVARRAAGWRATVVWMPPPLYVALKAMKQPRESWASLLTRLLAASGEIVANAGNTDTSVDDHDDREPK